jgi:hypothetical protein
MILLLNNPELSDLLFSKGLVDDKSLPAPPVNELKKFARFKLVCDSEDIILCIY